MSKFRCETNGCERPVANQELGLCEYHIIMGFREATTETMYGDYSEGRLFDFEWIIDTLLCIMMGDTSEDFKEFNLKKRIRKFARL